MAARINLPTMDEKRSPPRPRSLRRSRSIVLLIIIAIALYTLYSVRGVSNYTQQWIPSNSSGSSHPSTKTTNYEKKLVPLEAHIMSKCPDARDCLRDLVLPAMIRISDKVNWTLSFVGTPTENDGVDCRHGAPECMGNILMLCAAHLYPDTKINLGFTMCLEKNYRDIPGRELVQGCALEHAMDFEKLNDCAAQDDGAFGLGMLRDSVQRTTSAGVKKSCTVRLNEEIYCIRDDAEWKDCPSRAGPNDLVIAVEKLYGRS